MHRWSVDQPDKARRAGACWNSKDRMMAPEVAEEAFRAYAEETNRLNREHRVNDDGWRAELIMVEQAIRGIIAAIEEGLYQPSMKQRLEELERQKAELATRLSTVPTGVPDILPNVSGLYRKKVQRLVAALNDPRDQAEAAEAKLLRKLPGATMRKSASPLLFQLAVRGRPRRRQRLGLTAFPMCALLNWPGGRPNSRLKARLNAASKS